MQTAAMGAWLLWMIFPDLADALTVNGLIESAEFEPFVKNLRLMF
jgi:hypothetical protein